jgi:hypothetical protein
VAEVEDKVSRLARAVVEQMGRSTNEAAIAGQISRELVAMLTLNRRMPGTEDPTAWGTLLGWLFAQVAERVRQEADPDRPSREWLRGWTWDRVLGDAFRELGAQPREAAQQVAIIAALVAHARTFRAATLEERGVHRLLESLLADDQVQSVLRLNQYEGTWWFHRESWEGLMAWLVTVVAIESAADSSITPAAGDASLRACEDLAQRMVEAAAEAEYRLDRLVAQVTA